MTQAMEEGDISKRRRVLRSFSDYNKIFIYLQFWKAQTNDVVAVVVLFGLSHNICLGFYQSRLCVTVMVKQASVLEGRLPCLILTVLNEPLFANFIKHPINLSKHFFFLIDHLQIPITLLFCVCVFLERKKISGYIKLL